MRKILILLAALFAAPVCAQSGPHFGISGGVGATNCSAVSGEPVGGTCTYSINGATGAARFGSLAIGGTASFGDASYYAQILSGNPLLNFSSNNYLLYDRTGNAFSVNIGGTPKLVVSATGAGVNGDLAFQSTSSNINGGTSQIADAASVARSMQARATDRTSVFDFCATSAASGTSDATTCVQAAITALCARSPGGGLLYFPPGAYLINGTVLLPCAGLTIEGSGVGNPYGATGTHIIAGHRTDSAPVFQAKVTSFTSAAGEANAPSPSTGSQRFSFGPVIRNMTFENLSGSVSAGRPGPFVELNYTTYSLLDHVNMYASCVSLRVNGGFYVGVTDSQLETFQANCNAVELRGDKAKTFDTLDVAYFRSTEITAFGGGGACYDIADRVQTVQWTATTCETGGKSIRSTCPTMTSLQDCPGFFKLIDFESESFSSSDNMIDLTDLADGFEMVESPMRGYNSGSIANTIVSIVPSRFAASQQGLPITIANSWLKQAGGSCLYIQSENVTITGNHIYGCGRRADGPSYAAVEIRANHAAITGNVLCGDDYLHDAGSFAAGVLVSNNANFVAITGNIVRGGCSNLFLNPGTGTSVTATGNVGP